MAISLASIVAPNIFMQALVLLAVALLVTAGVYGSVAIIVKADDVGIYLAQRRGAIPRTIGKIIVHGMPAFLKMLSVVGTVAMLWVGGGIIIHGLHTYGIDWPEQAIHAANDAARTTIPSIGGLLAWLTGAITSAAFGLVLGAIAALTLVPTYIPVAYNSARVTHNPSLKLCLWQYRVSVWPLSRDLACRKQPRSVVARLFQFYGFDILISTMPSPNGDINRGDVRVATSHKVLSRAAANSRPSPRSEDLFQKTVLSGPSAKYLAAT